MSVIINSVSILSDSLVEPISLTDAKSWMRITYNEDDTLINDLISSSREHIEKLTGCSFVNKIIRTNLSLNGYQPNVWMVDMPYSPLICVDEVKLKTGINTYDILVKDDDYEVIGGKVWLYNIGNYSIKYQCGYSSAPDDIKSDILTLVAWSYENRGKKFQGDAKAGSLKEYPNWDGLNYHQYKKVVI